MHRSGKILACWALLGSILAACAAAQDDSRAAPKAVTMTEKQGNGTVALVQGQELVVSLGIQSGTGYTWQVTSKHPELLQQLGEPKLEREQPARPGAAARQVFRFKTQGIGEANLQLVYRRPFEKDVKPAKTFTLKVAVAPAK